MGIDESPRWLVSKRRNEEAIKILQKIARVNKGQDATIPDDIHFDEEIEKQVFTATSLIKYQHTHDCIHGHLQFILHVIN